MSKGVDSIAVPICCSRLRNSTIPGAVFDSGSGCKKICFNYRLEFQPQKGGFWLARLRNVCVPYTLMLSVYLQFRVVEFKK